MRDNIFYEKFGGSWYETVTNFWFPERHQKLIALIQQKPNGSILDVGCGTGKMLEAIRNKFPNLTLHGIDLSESMISFAKQNYLNSSFSVGSAENLPFEKEKFDILTNSISFHHYTNPEQAIREAYRVLKPTGQFLLMDISPNTNIKRRFLDFFAKYIARDGHVGFRTPDEIKNWFEKAGFKNISQCKAGFFEVVVTSGFKS